MSLSLGIMTCKFEKKSVPKTLGTFVFLCVCAWQGVREAARKREREKGVR